MSFNIVLMRCKAQNYIKRDQITVVARETT